MGVIGVPLPGPRRPPSWTTARAHPGSPFLASRARLAAALLSYSRVSRHLPSVYRSESMARGLPLLVLTLAIAANLEAQPSTSHSTFKVIVNAKVGGPSLARKVLAQIYPRKLQRWGDGN